ncbi:MAG: HIRAN domain-containing protein [Lachnospiraceae bacterium]|nr:HIRAN domain-containing protein [Lachnospiraceae bacterium]
MDEMYFTITGTSHQHGQEFMEPKMRVKLVKEPDNEYDSEAIKVEMPGIGKIGYVANSPNTVIGESMSAGRIYDKIGDEAEGTVLYVLPKGILCVLDDGSKVEDERKG